MNQFERDVIKLAAKKVKKYRTSYADDSISKVLDDPSKYSSDELKSKIDAKIKEYKNSGHLVDNGSDPYTMYSTNRALPNLIRRASNTLLGTNFKVVDPYVYTKKFTNSEADRKDLALYTGQDIRFNSKNVPKLLKNLNRLINIHEITEAEAMKRHPDYGFAPDAFFGLSQLGALTAGGITAYLNRKNLLEKLPNIAAATIAGGVAGGTAAIPIMKLHDAIYGEELPLFSTHMGPDIVRLENNAVRIINDPEVTRIMSRLRTGSGETYSFQRGAKSEYGTKILSKKVLKQMQKHRPGSLVGEE